MIPKGAVLYVTGDAAQSDGMISVVWNQQDVMMFAVDIQVRSEREIA
jgi:hypothetical protein